MPMRLQPAVGSSDVQTTTRDVDKLFVGGLPGRQFARLPSSVRSTDGFYGCLASIDLDGRVWTPNLDDSDGGYLSDIADDVRQFVQPGCPGTDVADELNSHACDAQFVTGEVNKHIILISPIKQLMKVGLQS